MTNVRMEAALKRASKARESAIDATTQAEEETLTVDGDADRNETTRENAAAAQRVSDYAALARNASSEAYKIAFDDQQFRSQFLDAKTEEAYIVAVESLARLAEELSEGAEAELLSV